MPANSKEQVAELRNAVTTNAVSSYLELRERMTQMQAMDFWALSKQYCSRVLHSCNSIRQFQTICIPIYRTDFQVN